jgi:hypothetical protein
MALLSAYVLLEQSAGAERFLGQLKNCLSAQLHQDGGHSEDADNTLNNIMEFLPRLRTLAMLHKNCLARFRKQMMAEIKMEAADTGNGGGGGRNGNGTPNLVCFKGERIIGVTHLTCHSTQCIFKRQQQYHDFMNAFPPLYNELFASSTD